jgi:hypothetical protein
MINVICAVCRPLPIRSVSQRTRWSFDPMVRWITGISLFLFQFRIEILTHSWVKHSCYRVLILATTTSSRPSRPEFQHSSPTFRPGILAAAVVGTSSSRASPAVGNASVDDTDAVATATFFFANYGKSFVRTFNYSIRNTSKCQTSHLLVHLCLQASFFVGRMRLHRRGHKHGRIQRGWGRWHKQWPGAMIELYVL